MEIGIKYELQNKLFSKKQLKKKTKLGNKPTLKS